jgi:signal transduction histidine kinase
MNLDGPIDKFLLDRPAQRRTSDEFDQLVESINTMHSNLQSSFHEVTRYRDRLEEMVEERTAELGTAKARAEAALDSLHEVQDKLVEAEKMASLGMLVAGVAHEVNTPAGVCLTAVTTLDGVRRSTYERYSSGQLSKADLTKLFEQIELTDDLVQKNLRRIVRLVEDFKQTATNNVQDEHHAFPLRSLVDDVISTLDPKLCDDSKEISVDIADDLVIESIPGVLSQVLTNLLNNSLIHAFAPGKPGRIEISADVDQDHLRLMVVDHGAGMDEATQAKIFDPFFTTKRGKGGTGLGMHIVYNLVAQKLKGDIQCESSPGAGTTFRLVLPLKEPDGLFQGAGDSALAM